MELKAPKAILFDWDNTLVNTWPIIHSALHTTFTQMGLEPWSIQTVKQRVSRSMRDSFPLIFGDDWQRAADIYQASFRAIHLQRLEALPGAEATLQLLATLPVYVAVVSNKKGPNLRKESAHIGWNKYFTKLVGADDTARDKPFPEPVISAMEGSGLKPGADVWFIGDSVVDMEVAHVTGCVPVWYGELPAEPLSHGFDQRFITHDDLQQGLRQLFV
jgi:phosphoglycolate phosphatase